MDPFRFDSLARALAGPGTRRGLLAALAALTPAAAAAQGKNRRAGDAGGTAQGHGGGSGAEHCAANGQRCGKGAGRRGKSCAKCCSRFSVAQANGKRRCSCKPAGTPARAAAHCCSGQRSAGGFCGACDPGLAACASGCVDLDTDDANCGACGNACASGRACVAGACACTAARCPDGCCDGDTCMPGTADGACGTGGAACAACRSPERCGGSGTPAVCGCLPVRAACTDSAECCGRDCYWGFCS